jgi:hypothetical protein
MIWRPNLISFDKERTTTVRFERKWALVPNNTYDWAPIVPLWTSFKMNWIELRTESLAMPNSIQWRSSWTNFWKRIEFRLCCWVGIKRIPSRWSFIHSLSQLLFRSTWTLCLRFILHFNFLYRNFEAVSKLSSYPGGLYPLAAAMISTVTSTRIIALEVWKYCHCLR